MASRPQNIGIKAAEIYFPSQVSDPCHSPDVPLDPSSKEKKGDEWPPLPLSTLVCPSSPDIASEAERNSRLTRSVF